jgi:hypothetical protein
MRVTIVKRLACVLIGLTTVPCTALAQRAVQDKTALQALALFQHTCLPYAGMAGDLRMLAASKQMVPVPAATAAAFLGGEPGMAFWANTPDVKMVLVSNDSGACRIIMDHGDKTNVEQALQDYFTSLGILPAEIDQKVSPDGKARQSLWLASFHERSWLISVTTHAHSEAPNGLPTLILLATSQKRVGPQP